MGRSVSYESHLPVWHYHLDCSAPCCCRQSLSSLTHHVLIYRRGMVLPNSTQWRSHRWVSYRLLLSLYSPWFINYGSTKVKAGVNTIDVSEQLSGLAKNCCFQKFCFFIKLHFNSYFSPRQTLWWHLQQDLTIAFVWKVLELIYGKISIWKNNMFCIMMEAQKTSKTVMLEFHNSLDDKALFSWSSNFFHLVIVMGIGIAIVKSNNAST